MKAKSRIRSALKKADGSSVPVKAADLAECADASGDARLIALADGFRGSEGTVSLSRGDAGALAAGEVKHASGSEQGPAPGSPAGDSGTGTPPRSDGA